MAKTNLVIVESPAKAKTIEKYLGPGFVVKASMGHVRDLPKSKIGVDLEGDFTPEYQPLKAKEDVIKDLKKLAKKSDNLYLATDPDREGEAISWHLKELLEFPEANTFRVTFNEITKKVVTHAIAHPRQLDQNLVDAQQARRILDRIVGYQLSPLLWTTIKRGLSAGRVQSVATRLVYDREMEIRAFISKEYWSIDVNLGRIAPQLGNFKAHFHGIDKKMELNSAEDVKAVMDVVKADQFVVTKVKKQERNRSPVPPFITSSLQQDASRRLYMSPSKTMSVAQQLYEGIDIEGHGTVGLITYMRTDSLRLSDEAVDAARSFIQSRYGKDYCPPNAKEYKTKSGAQDAHEAIRPSDVTMVPEDIKKSLTPDQFKLYKLIWSRFLACQMTNAVYDALTIDSSSGGYIFRASHSSLKFAGFLAVYEEGKDEEDTEKEVPLPDLQEGESLNLLDTKENQHFTQPPGRYSEATLIRAMEERGIGRPSTYAPTISNIIYREYLIKEGKSLRISPLGEVVTGLMTAKFSDVVDFNFTAQMEAKLDKVETGEANWRGILGDFYNEFSANLDKAEKELTAELKGERIRIPVEETDEICDECGKNLVIKSGRFGRFLSCPAYPECTFSKPLVVEMPGKCPLCENRILKKTSRKGYTYYGCEKNSEKDEKAHCDFMTWDVPVKENCPECEKTMFKKSGRGAKKPFCITETCGNFTPEEKRGGYKKKPVKKEGEEGSEESLSIADGAAPPEQEPTKKSKTVASKKTTTKSTTKKVTKSKKATADGEDTEEKPKRSRSKKAVESLEGEEPVKKTRNSSKKTDTAESSAIDEVPVKKTRKSTKKTDTTESSASDEVPVKKTRKSTKKTVDNVDEGELLAPPQKEDKIREEVFDDTLTPPQKEDRIREEVFDDTLTPPQKPKG